MEAITLILEERWSSPGDGSSPLYAYERERGRAWSPHPSTCPPHGCRIVAHAQPLHFLCPCRGLPTDAKTLRSFLHAASVYQPPVIWEAGFPGGTAQVAVMSLARSASRTICPSFCPHFIYVMAHLVNSRIPATHLLITTC